jgi:hypothetical protein
LVGLLAGWFCLVPWLAGLLVGWLAGLLHYCIVGGIIGGIFALLYAFFALLAAYIWLHCYLLARRGPLAQLALLSHV